MELMLLGLFLASWLVALLYLFGVIPLAGTLHLGLYGLYSLAAAAGWLSGNVYLHRARRLPAEVRRRLLVVYFLGPPGILYLVRAMAPLPVQAAAPLVPIYGFVVFAIFFLVPVTLARPRRW